MTRNELEQGYFLKREIEHNEKRLARFRRELEGAKTTRTGEHADCSADDITGRKIAWLIDMERLIANQQEELRIRYRIINYFIDNVADPEMRTILRLRNLECKRRWADVAKGMGEFVSEDAVKKRYYRFVNNL